ncbi:hypothetical protein L195_g050739, partial [Trifolium pratense]
MTKVVRGSSDVIEGEALGLNAALDVVEHFADTPMIIEMDSLTIVE